MCVIYNNNNNVWYLHRRRNRGGTGGMCPPPKFDKLLYKLLTTLCVVSDCAPPIKKSFLRQWPGTLLLIWLSLHDRREQEQTNNVTSESKKSFEIKCVLSTTASTNISIILTLTLHHELCPLLLYFLCMTGHGLTTSKTILQPLQNFTSDFFSMCQYHRNTECRAEHANLLF